MLIYKITNNINGMVYIGQTIVSIKKRWNAHCHNVRTSYISRAIRNNGIENFTIEEIDGANSLSELNYLEQHYIFIYNSIVPNGYNLLPGGRNSRHTKETSEKISKAKKGKKRKPHSLETLQKIADGNRGKKLSKEHIEFLKNRIVTEESRKKLSNSLKGRQSWSKGKKFSQKHLENLSKVRKGFTSKARKDAHKKSSIKRTKNIKATNLITLEIRYYKGLKEAEKDLNIHHGNISKICNKKNGYYKTLTGWTFEYV